MLSKQECLEWDTRGSYDPHPSAPMPQWHALDTQYFEITTAICMIKQHETKLL